MVVKKLIIISILVAVVICSATVVVFAGSNLRYTKNVYRVEGLDGTANTVSKFTDGDVRCYVVSSNGYYNGGANGISCVRAE